MESSDRELTNRRERLFWGVSELTAFSFAGMIILKEIHIKQKIYGGKLQESIKNICKGVWSPGTDLLYTILNTYEEEGYLKSFWNCDADKNKRYLRLYSLTPSGYQYFINSAGNVIDEIKKMRSICQKCLDYIFKNRPNETRYTFQPANKEMMSSALFTSLNALYCLSFRYNAYAQEIKEYLSEVYRNIWNISDSMLYPALSQMEQQGVLNSNWNDLSKKRTIRRYRITEKGKQHLFFLLSDDSGIQKKLKNMIDMCSSVISYLIGLK